ncbi:MAG: 4Fe-4S binding protein [Candidatus Lindowbacteria bacterium]|nr:4Fe-4S binding protein [Candidatus Lindowbacteria bacterium]
MSDSAYLKLREFLDQFPLGFPATDSGVEIEILKRLFTPEEAEVAVLLTPFPEEVSSIASRTGLREAELGKKLDSMSKKGLVFRIRRGGDTLYNSAPFMIGLYEYSVKQIDADLARLFKKYYESAYVDEMGASDVPGFKVLPVDENIEAGAVLIPSYQLKESIKAARKIAGAECVCRKESRLTGEPCEHPIETCLSFGAAAEYYVENGIGREITAEEAIKIVDEADKSGLVHAGANTKHLSNVCNCCPCCCASMKGITQRGYDKHKYLNALFEAHVDKDACTNCEACVGRCPVGAITMLEAATVDRAKCLGCGLCASGCPVTAITLVLREDREEPFERVLEMGAAILDGKQKKKRHP